MNSNKKVHVEVFGPDPPCQRCTAVAKSLERAASMLRLEGIDVTVKKLDIMSRDVVSKYGVLMSPALALNGTVRVMGRVPGTEEIERLIRETAR